MLQFLVQLVFQEIVLLKHGDKFTVIVGVSNLQTSRGIIAIDATLEYDTSKLTYVSMSNTGNWSKPSYNESNGKLVTDRSDFGKTSESVFRITFMAKEGSSGDAYIKLNDITIADGIEDGFASNASKTIAISKNNGSTNNNNNNNNVTATTNKNVNQVNNNVEPDEENIIGEIEENTNIDENVGNASEPEEIKEDTSIKPEIEEKKFEMKYVYYGARSCGFTWSIRRVRLFYNISQKRKTWKKAKCRTR